MPHRLGAADLVTPLREVSRTQTQRLTGNRIRPMANRLGGLGVDADAECLRSERDAMRRVRDVAEHVTSLIDSPSFADQTIGRGELSRAIAERYGVTGPAARASGVDLDLRRARPNLAYGGLAELITRPTATGDDAYARLRPWPRSSPGPRSWSWPASTGHVVGDIDR